MTTTGVVGKIYATNVNELKMRKVMSNYVHDEIDDITKEQGVCAGL